MIAALRRSRAILFSDSTLQFTTEPRQTTPQFTFHGLQYVFVIPHFRHLHLLLLLFYFLGVGVGHLLIGGRRIGVDFRGGEGGVDVGRGARGFVPRPSGG